MKFGGIIREWYEKNRRELPWRYTKDPYLIWLSEVILQQTRVDQGLAYYQALSSTYPDVRSLAAALEDEILKLWQGLGYYSRARNLHEAAGAVMEHHGGMIPENYQELLGLKGVGEYTASAIASICFGESRAVVDGNVSRVISRIYGVEEAIDSNAGRKEVKQLAARLMERAVKEGCDPGTHNQAMMEFGALQCIPASPVCDTCPLSEGCTAFQAGNVDRLPAKLPKRKPSNRWMYFYIITCKGETILQKRSNRDIWRSLYQFPVTEGKGPASREEIMDGLFKRVMKQLRDPNASPDNPVIPSDRIISFTRFAGPIRHQLTHRTIHACFIHVEVNPLPLSLPEGFLHIPMERFSEYPVPVLIHRYMESTGS